MFASILTSFFATKRIAIAGDGNKFTITAPSSFLFQNNFADSPIPACPFHFMNLHVYCTTINRVQKLVIASSILALLAADSTCQFLGFLIRRAGQTATASLHMIE